MLSNLLAILLLAFLEGVLSIDNAIVLALLARRLPPARQRQALTYGLVGALIFRLIALAGIIWLLHWAWIKWIGGAYLLFIGFKYFWKRKQSPHHPAEPAPASESARFWRTVLLIELSDIAFALDSILAAIALSRKFWVIFAGGFLGVIAVRFASMLFIRALRKWPGLETTAYLMIFVIGTKLLLEAANLPGLDFHSPENPAFWALWGAIALCFLATLRHQ